MLERFCARSQLRHEPSEAAESNSEASAQRYLFYEKKMSVFCAENIVEMWTASPPTEFTSFSWGKYLVKATLCAKWRWSRKSKQIKLRKTEIRWRSKLSRLSTTVGFLSRNLTSKRFWIIRNCRVRSRNSSAKSWSQLSGQQTPNNIAFYILGDGPDRSEMCYRMPPGTAILDRVPQRP